MRKTALTALALLLFVGDSGLSARGKAPFDLTDALIPSDQIHRGGPAKDGIPSIDHPKFTPTGQSSLNDDDRVLGLAYQGVSKAYPIRILNWHEIVNDEFRGHPVAITFCPLCGSGIAFSSEIRGETITFGVSGLLYNSDVLLYDRKTNSLWSQLMNRAVSGPLKGTRLISVPLTHTTWRDWKSRYPDTLVLSENTGYQRDYNRNPYQNYKLDRRIWFPVANENDSYHPKELVLGIVVNGVSKAYPFSELSDMPLTFKDEIAGEPFTVQHHPIHQTASIYDRADEETPSAITFWFAWYAFHPDTLIFRSRENKHERANY